MTIKKKTRDSAKKKKTAFCAGFQHENKSCQLVAIRYQLRKGKGPTIAGENQGEPWLRGYVRERTRNRIDLFIFGGYSSVASLHNFFLKKKYIHSVAQQNRARILTSTLKKKPLPKRVRKTNIKLTAFDFVPHRLTDFSYLALKKKQIFISYTGLISAWILNTDNDSQCAK